MLEPGTRQRAAGKRIRAMPRGGWKDFLIEIFATRPRAEAEAWTAADLPLIELTQPDIDHIDHNNRDSPLEVGGAIPHEGRPPIGLGF